MLTSHHDSPLPRLPDVFAGGLQPQGEIGKAIMIITISAEVMQWALSHGSLLEPGRQ